MSMNMDIGRIEGLVRFGKSKKQTHGKLHFKAVIDEKNTKMIVNYDSLIDKYRDFINPYLIPVELNDKQMEKYRYHPRKYCEDNYGNMDLWSTLLRVNNMLTSSDFTKKRIITFTSGIHEILDEILMMEDQYLENNYIDVLKK